MVWSVYEIHISEFVNIHVLYHLHFSVPCEAGTYSIALNSDVCLECDPVCCIILIICQTTMQKNRMIFRAIINRTKGKVHACSAQKGPSPTVLEM